MAHHHTLAQFERDFELWRSTRSSPKQKTPDSLKARVLSLRERYGISLVCRTLKLNNQVVKTWVREPLLDQNQSMPEPQRFINLNQLIEHDRPQPSWVEYAQDRDLPQSLAQPSLELNMPNGINLVFRGQLSAEVLTHLIAQVRS